MADSSPRRQPAQVAFTRSDLVIAAVLAAVVLVLGCLRTTRSAGTFHDDGIYIATAKAIAEGHGYRLINLPSEPLQTKYPFLYPICLAVLWTVWSSFPQNLFLIQMFSVCCAAASVAAAYLFLVRFRYGSTWVCAASCLIAATSASHLFFATQALSEALFGLLVVAALWACETASERPTTAGQRFFLGLLTSISFDARTIGAASVVGGADHLRRYGRVSRSILCGIAVPVVAWVAWVAIAATTQTGEAAAPAYYSVQNYTSWWLESSTNVPFLNLVWIVFGTIQLTAEVVFEAVPWPIPIALGVLTWVHIISGPGCKRLVPKTLFIYAIVLTFWPWPPRRFLGPLLPFLVFYLAQSLRYASRSWRPAFSRSSGALLAIALVSVNLYSGIRTVSLIRQTGYPFFGFKPRERVMWNDYERLFAWVKANTRERDVIASGMDSMVYLYTNRKSVRAFVARPTALIYGDPSPALGTLDEFVARFRQFGVHYVVRLPMPGYAEARPLSELFTEARLRFPGCLTEVFRLNDDPRFVVYETHLQECGN